MKIRCMLIVIMLLLLCSACAEADNNAGDDITWVLEGDTLILSGTGDMYDFRDFLKMNAYRGMITALI